MNVLSIIQLAIQWAGPVKAAIDLASSNMDLITKIKQLSAPLASILEGIGAELFPKAAPELHLVGGVIAAFDPNVTKWLQGSLNTVLNLTPPLVVDGMYGAKTRDAVEQLQAKLGLKVDGLAGALTQAAIAAALAKLSPK
jgi:peptidoglycan hydrolase-like protein with peptidoglycan-binding domain